MKKTLLIALVAFMITGCASKPVKEGSEEIGIINPNTEVAEDKDTDTNEVSVEEDSKGSEENPEEAKQEDKPSSGQTASSGNSTTKPTETKPNTGGNTTTTKPSTGGSTTTITKPNTSTGSGSTTTTKPAETKPSTGGSTTTKPAETKPAETKPAEAKPTTPTTPPKDVVETKIVEEKGITLPRKTEYRENHSLKAGVEKVVQEGSDGYILNTFEITYKNGVQVSKLRKSSKTVAQVPRIIEKGTDSSIDPYYVNSAGLLNTVNNLRSQNGVGSLTYSSRLEALAKQRAKEISDEFRKTGDISHTGAKESENIQVAPSLNINTIASVWNNSTKGHREARLNSVFKYYASAIYVDSRGVYLAVEVFSTTP